MSNITNLCQIALFTLPLAYHKLQMEMIAIKVVWDIDINVDKISI